MQLISSKPTPQTRDSQETNGYKQYVRDGDTYYLAKETVPRLEPGYYTPGYNHSQNEYCFRKKNIVSPKLYILPNSAKNLILDDIKRFWTREALYKQFHSVYKRNILLYSIPGNGKTSLINILCNELIKEYEGVVFCIDTKDDLVNYMRAMAGFKQIEPNRKVITIIEDFERLATDNYFTSLLLQILDGNDQMDNLVTIATTNHPEKLEKKFTCRPSRFNLVMEYKKPTEDVRRFYITHKLQDGGVDIESKEMKDKIEYYVQKSQGYTFDFLKELLQGIFIDGIDEQVMFERIENSIEKDGLYKITEDEGKKVGFISDDEDNNDCLTGIVEDYDLEVTDHDPMSNLRREDQTSRPIGFTYD